MIEDAQTPLDGQPSEPSPLVLIVEDDEAAARLAQTYLKRAGFRSKHLWEGSQTVAATKALTPALILLDLHLPGIDGFEVCRRLKADPETAYAPIVIVSSHRSRENVMEALECGADDFLVKPLDPQVLLHKLHSNLPEPETESEVERRESRESGEEHRNYIRINEMADAVLHLPLEIIDISEGGLGLLADAPMEPGSVLKIQSERLGEIVGETQLPIRVRYTREHKGRRRYRMGVEFVGLGEPERKRIRRYIFKRQTDRVRTHV